MKLPRIQCSAGVLNLIAFVSTLIAIVCMAKIGKADIAILTGLIGVAGSFRPVQNHVAPREDER